MNAFRWELRRKVDGLLVDRAHRLAWLRRAAGASIVATGAGKGRAHIVVHAPSGTVVGQFGGHGGHGWQFDSDLIARLEPDEEAP